MLFYDDEDRNVHRVRVPCSSVDIEWMRFTNIVVHPCICWLLTILVLQVSKLGVTSVLVSTREGVSVNTLREGLQAYNKQAG